MRVLICFLLLSFLSGARAARSGREDRALWALAGCVVVAGLYTFERFA